MFVYHVDKIHSLWIETEETDPFFEVDVFLFYLFYEVGE